MTQKKQEQESQSAQQMTPARLKLSRFAWDKIRYIQEVKSKGNEIFFFAISSEKDSLFVEDVIMTEQENSTARVEVTDEGIARYVGDCMKKYGTNSDRYMRIWIHTHPSGVTSASSHDEQIWKDIFGACPWTVMLVLPTGGDPYCRLRVRVLEKYYVDTKIDVEVSKYAHWHKYLEEWEKEADENMKEKSWQNSYHDDYGSHFGYNSRHTNNNNNHLFQEGDSVDLANTGQDEGQDLDTNTESPNFSRFGFMSAVDQEVECERLLNDITEGVSPHTILKDMDYQLEITFADYCKECTGKHPYNVKKEVLEEVLDDFIYYWQIHIDDEYTKEEMRGYANDEN